MHAVPDQIRQWVPGDFATLGADGFGFCDTRAAARRFFKIDGPSIVVRTLQALARRGEVDPFASPQAIEKYRLHDVTAGTSGNAPAAKARRPGTASSSRDEGADARLAAHALR